MDDVKGLWVEELPNTMLAIRMTVHLSTRDTPFNLAFRSNAFISVEIGINTLRVRHFDLKKNESRIWDNLDLLEEVIVEASLKVASRQR